MEDAYKTLGKIFESTLRPGDNVVEIFSWEKPMLPTLAKQAIGQAKGDGSYIMVSDWYREHPKSLFQGFMAMYSDYLLRQDGVNLKDAGELDGRLLSHVRRPYLMEAIVKAHKPGRRFDQVTQDEADEFCRNSGIVLEARTMPPVLNQPEGIRMMIEKEAYTPRDWDAVMESACDAVEAGGHMLFMEKNNYDDMHRHTKKALGNHTVILDDYPAGLWKLLLIRKDPISL